MFCATSKLHALFLVLMQIAQSKWFSFCLIVNIYSGMMVAEEINPIKSFYVFKFCKKEILTALIIINSIG